MGTYEYAIDVNVPLNTAYNQWTQFEEFPLFMDGVESVEQIDEETLYRHAEIAGVDQKWRAKITEQTPDQRVAWTSVEGAKNAGVVTFHHIDDDTTRVMLQMDYNPEGFIENVGAALGIVEQRIKGDLERFKTFIEQRGVATGAWRGEIEQPG